MPDRITTTPGLYPLPDRARDELADLKGHQKHDLVSGDEGEEITAVYDRAREEVIAWQREAGLDRVVEGQLRWDDMLAHPLCVHDAVETRGLRRYYDNNNFYREPVVVEALDRDGDLAGDLAAAAEFTDRLQAVAPGPYTLSDLATDEHYGDEDEFLGAVGEFVAGEVAAFPDAVETLFLLEPSLVASPPDDGHDERASAVIDAVARATDAEVVVHTYWGALDEGVHAHLLDADVDAIGYDLVTATEATLEVVSEYGTTEDVALGLVDGQNTLVESTETVADRIDRFCERLPPAADVGTIYATVNTELFYLPVNRAREKLAALGAVTGRAEVGA